MTAPTPDRATAHAPQTHDEIQAAARQMAANNYSINTIAAALKLDAVVVRQLLGSTAPK